MHLELNWMYDLKYLWEMSTLVIILLWAYMTSLTTLLLDVKIFHRKNFAIYFLVNTPLVIDKVLDICRYVDIIVDIS